MSKRKNPCLNDTHPDVASWCKNHEDALCYSAHSKTYIDWVCPYCGEDIPHKSISNIVRDGLSCPKCSDGISYPQKLMMHVLCHIRDNYLPWLEIETEYSPEWCIYPYNEELHKGRYDFLLSAVGIPLVVIEMHGSFHFEDNPLSGQDSIDSYWIDAFKMNLTTSRHIKYFAIDCRVSELNYIKNNIIKELHDWFIIHKVDLNTDIDWENCERRSLKTIVKEVCELYNEGLLPYEIQDKTLLSRSAVYTYLKKGSLIGLCNYPDGREMRHKAQWTKEYFSKPVICFNDNKIFYGAKEAKEYYLNISTYNQINGWAARKSRCTILHPNGKPYDFMYVEDYNTYGYIPIQGYNAETNEYERKIPEHYKKPVVCVTLKEHFSSIIKASEKYNLDKKQIWYNCIGKCVSVGMYNGEHLIWRWEEDYDENNEYIYNDMVTRGGGRKAIPVFCVNFNERFVSSEEGGEKYGVFREHINFCANGRTSYAGIIPHNKEPLVWRYEYDYDPKEKILLPKIHNKQIRYIDLNTQVVFNTTKDLASYFNIGSQNNHIQNIIKNGIGQLKTGETIMRLDNYFSQHPEIHNQIEFYRNHVWLGEHD